MYYHGDYKSPKGAMEDETIYCDTAFAVVAYLTYGRAKGVWLVFDFYPFDEASAECHHVHDDLDWGWLPNHEE